jgi:hypothetical protein
MKGQMGQGSQRTSTANYTFSVEMGLIIITWEQALYIMLSG